MAGGLGDPLGDAEAVGVVVVAGAVVVLAGAVAGLVAAVGGTPGGLFGGGWLAGGGWPKELKAMVTEKRLAISVVFIG